MKLFKRKDKVVNDVFSTMEHKFRMLYKEPWVQIMLNTRTNMLELSVGSINTDEVQKTHELPIFLEMNRYHVASWIQSIGVPFTKNLENICGTVVDKVSQYIKDAMVSQDKLIYAEELENVIQDTSSFKCTLEKDVDMPSCVIKAVFNIPSLGWTIEHRCRNLYTTVSKDLNVYFTARLYEPEPEFTL